MKNLLLVRADLDTTWRKRITDGGPFCTFGRWENLAMWQGDQLKYSATSHENLAMYFGSATQLRSLGAEPKPLEGQFGPLVPLSATSARSIWALVQTQSA